MYYKCWAFPQSSTILLTVLLVQINVQKLLAKWHKIKWYTAFKPIYSWLVFRGMQLQCTQQLAMTLHWPCGRGKGHTLENMHYRIAKQKIHFRCDLFSPHVRLEIKASCTHISIPWGGNWAGKELINIET